MRPGRGEVSGFGEGPGSEENEMFKNEVRERMLSDGPRALSDGDLLSVLGAGSAASRAVAELAWLSVGELRQLGLGGFGAAVVAAAFELGRRGAWAPPKRGERCLSPDRVYELTRALPARLQSVLPTVEEIEAELSREDGVVDT